MPSAFNEIQRPRHPEILEGRDQPIEDCGADQVFERAERLLDKVDVICSRLQWLIDDNIRSQGIRRQIDPTCAQA